MDCPNCGGNVIEQPSASPEYRKVWCSQIKRCGWTGFLHIPTNTYLKIKGKKIAIKNKLPKRGRYSGKSNSENKFNDYQ